MSKFVSLFILSLVLLSTCMASDFSNLDPDQLVPKKMLAKALDFFEKNQSSIPNKKFISLIDFSKHNSENRFFIIDMDSGLVETFLVAHGKKSDPDFDGFATIFSNVIDSNMSSLGFFLTAETYFGEHGHSLRLDGLSKSNSNARERAIVIHGADYVFPGNKIGRSLGCPVLEPRYTQQVIDEIKEGTLLFADY